MRIAVPQNISLLADKIAPYMMLDREKKQYVLKENAPAEIVQAKRKYHEWFLENVKR